MSPNLKVIDCTAMLTPNTSSPTANPGYLNAFKPGKLTFGLFQPIEAYTGDQPTMAGQVELAQYAEQHGFSSLLFRDVPLRDPNFGDNGQIYDVWTYLGYMAGQTKEIALLTGAIVLPLRHPLHTAKAAASIDQLSNGRLLLGVASGDRVIEFPAFGVDFESRGESFRNNLQILKAVWERQYPTLESQYGILSGADVVPKPVAARPPILITGFSQQNLEWVAGNADGWITYPRNFDSQAQLINQWRELTRNSGVYKPISQSFMVDLSDNPNEGPSAIHLGYRLGRNVLVQYLEGTQQIGIDHIMFNLKFGRRPAKEVLQELCEFVLPAFK